MDAGMKLLSISRRAAACLSLAGLLALATPLSAQERFIVMASTTSTEQSGLFPHLLPAFKAATGIDVRVVALGTGQPVTENVAAAWARR